LSGPKNAFHADRAVSASQEALPGASPKEQPPILADVHYSITVLHV
jgi:hypothetical protein